MTNVNWNSRKKIAGKSPVCIASSLCVFSLSLRLIPLSFALLIYCARIIHFYYLNIKEEEEPAKVEDDRERPDRSKKEKTNTTRDSCAAEHQKISEEH